jgi:hypothetical protein
MSDKCYGLLSMECVGYCRKKSDIDVLIVIY